MAITALSTQPNSVTRPDTFNADSDTFHSELPTLISDINTAVAGMNSLSSGGNAIPYTFSTTTADADPGAGFLRLDNATQNAATTIRADLVGSDGTTWTDVLATFDDSTSTVKGQIRLMLASDATKWIDFSLTALASPAGYKNLTVTVVGSSAASPFANGDGILLKFTRTGDKGETGKAAGFSYTYSTTTTATDPTAGKIQFNNATLASATALYISETDGDANGIAAEIATWDDSSSTTKAKLKVYKTTDPTKFAIFNITGTLTDNGAWDTLTVAYVTGAGTLSDTDAVTLLVVRTGDAGGPTGFTLGTPVASTSGTSIDFTSLPAGVEMILINLAGVSTNGGSVPLIQIGDSGGVEATGYSAESTQITGTNQCARAASTAGFPILNNNGATDAFHGIVTLTLENSSSNTWCASGVLVNMSSGTVHVAGSKSLTGTLDRVRLTATNGTDTFDAGEINIAYI